MNLLLVRLRLIGDVVFTTPVIRELRRRYPDARLTYLVEDAAAPVVSGNPHLTDVIAIPHSRGLRRLRDDLRIARMLRARHFDLAIDLHGGPRSAWLTWASRAPVRVGYDVPGRRWMYTRVFRRPRNRGPIHSVENQWDLLAVLDPTADRPERLRDRVEMPVDPAARDRLDGRLSRYGVPPTGRVVVLHVSAGNPFRRWPESSFADLAAELARAAENRWVLVTSGPSDHAAAARVVNAARAAVPAAGSRVLDAEGVSLAELRALMDRPPLFVGGDSGPLHIAATSNVPIVGLYGPTLPARSAPWRPRHLPTASVDAGALPCRPCDQRACVPGDFRCLTGVGAGAVIAAAEGLLEHSE